MVRPRYQEIAFIQQLRSTISLFFPVSVLLIVYVLLVLLGHYGVLAVPETLYYVLGGVTLLVYAGASANAFLTGYQYWGVSRGASLLLAGGVMGAILSVFVAVAVFFKEKLGVLMGSSYWVFLGVALLIINITFVLMSASLLWLRKYGVSSVYLLLGISVVPGINMIVLPLISYRIIDRLFAEYAEKAVERKEGAEEEWYGE